MIVVLLMVVAVGLRLVTQQKLQPKECRQAKIYALSHPKEKGEQVEDI